LVRECACVELTSHPNTGSIKTTGVVLGDDLIQKIDEERDGVPRSLFIRRILWARYQEEEEEEKKKRKRRLAARVHWGQPWSAVQQQPRLLVLVSTMNRLSLYPLKHCGFWFPNFLGKRRLIV
jgi:hypothetical protein